LALCLLVPVGAADAQVVRRTGFTPMSEAQFGVARQFYDYDATLPLNLRRVQTFDDERSTFEKLVFDAPGHDRVPGYLALPKSGRAPYPCVLLVHGMNDSKDYWWDHRVAPGLTRRLLDAGFAIYAIDLRYHGERAATLDYMAPMYLTYEDSLFVTSRNMLIQSTIDLRRALDVLRGRSDIDTSRLAAAGVSMGAMVSICLAALEPGLRAIACASTPSHLQPLPIDHYSFAVRTGQPVLLMGGTQDWHTSPEDTRVLLNLFPNADRRMTVYEGGHSLPEEWTAEAADWLTARLRAGPGR
jgi:dienelactone hydrolase